MNVNWSNGFSPQFPNNKPKKNQDLIILNSVAYLDASSVMTMRVSPTSEIISPIHETYDNTSSSVWLTIAMSVLELMS